MMDKIQKIMVRYDQKNDTQLGIHFEVFLNDKHEVCEMFEKVNWGDVTFKELYTHVCILLSNYVRHHNLDISSDELMRALMSADILDFSTFVELPRMCVTNKLAHG